MKTFLRLSFISAVVLSLASCQKVTQTTVYTANVPQYMTYEDLRSSIANDNDKGLERPGKIFLYNSLILINDYETGIHIYDNSNPSAPSHIGFVNIPGNVDIALRDNTLYVDSYVDLVAIDISDPTNVREIGRAKDVLSYTIPSQMDWEYPVAKIDQEKGVVTGYEVAEIEETCENQECRTFYTSNLGSDWDGAWGGGMMSEDGSPVSFSGSANNVRSSSSSSSGGTGIAGSMARFMMIGDYLYVISDMNTVRVFDISTTNMHEVHSFRPWENDGNAWGVIETLFTFKDRLFIGSNMGMLAYDVSNPASPTYLSNYNHMTACDPVVANDDYAFVTLRSGNNCNWGNANQMDVLDIADIMSPTMITSVTLSNPHGLDIDSENNMVFVCDGFDGLKVYDFTEVAQVGSNMLTHEQGFSTYDVILNNGLAHVIGDGGLSQFSYDEKGNLQKVSTIALD